MLKFRVLRLKFFFTITCLTLSLTASANGETLYALVPLSPANENPPIAGLDATGGMLVTIDVTRNSAGAVTAARMFFTGSVAFPGSVTITGLHIHEADSRTNGGVRFDTGINAMNNLMFANGIGVIQREVATVNLDALGRLLANPAGFYVNLHTSVNPGGAIRGQINRFSENMAMTTALSPLQENPPLTDLNAFGSATVTVNATRNATGAVTGGTVNFTVGYNFPGNVIIRGLHIHEGPVGVNAGIVIDTGLSATNTITNASGRGLFSHTIFLTTPASIAATARLLNNPANFYVNLHTSVHPGGAIRGQLGGTFVAAPIIAQAAPLNLTTGAAGVTVNLLAANLDAGSEVLVNGVQTQFALIPNSGPIGLAAAQIPADLRANPGVIALQIRNGNGLISQPVYVVVGANQGTPGAVLDAAGYANTVSPEGIAAVFGVNLSTNTVANSAAILPNALDGTSVYVNGVPAPLFFVSPGQINFQVPEGTVPGPAAVIVRNSAGALARAVVNVANVAPGIFTHLANGKGAPAARASTDSGQTFPLVMSNADGTPVEIQTGNIVMLFGTGLRFRSTSQVTATAGGVELSPSFAGAQGTFVGLDQINLTIPASMAGKGETDLVFTVDGKAANAIRIKVK
jgi:uncharacterized protein (TIGR03437 family)